MDNELAILRRRHADLEADLSRVLATATAGTAALVAEVASASPAGTMFALNPCGVACEEGENAAPTFTPADDTFYGLHLGTTAPSIGDHVLVTQVGGIFVFP